ncbi:MAG: 3-deoxy-8-phosphooctulonate synthase [bacterium]
MNIIRVSNIKIGEEFVLIAGPCVIENEEITYDTALRIKRITGRLKIPFIFKSSYDKANRSSIDSYRGPGIKEGLRILGKIKKELDIPIITDVHCKTEIDEVAKVVDIIQIPAFLCRQTDLIIEAAKTGIPVNIKKGQFMSPQDMRHIVQKIESIEKGKILLTERGTFFGYNNLVVDFRSFPIMREFGYPLIFDVTHSSQDRKFVPYFTRAACASGIDGLFMEVHPEPENALCDGQSMVRLDDLEEILNQAKKILAK